MALTLFYDLILFYSFILDSDLVLVVSLSLCTKTTKGKVNWINFLFRLRFVSRIKY